MFRPKYRVSQTTRQVESEFTEGRRVLYAIVRARGKGKLAVESTRTVSVIRSCMTRSLGTVPHLAPVAVRLGLRVLSSSTAVLVLELKKDGRPCQSEEEVRS